MRYWAYLLGKLGVAGAFLYAAWQGLMLLFPEPHTFMYVQQEPFLHDVNYTFAVILFGLFATGVIYLVIWDQRYRCRTCLRRLRMPVVTGSWSEMLRLGRPRTEYICPYGHGTLKVPELQITGHEPANWTPHEDIWKELTKH